MMAAEMSCKLGWLESATVKRIEQLFVRARLPVGPPAGMTVSNFLQLMSVDKKVLDGNLRLVLLKMLGKAVVTSEFDQAVLESVIGQFCRLE
jgi:3-dehydroquinate synthase